MRKVLILMVLVGGGLFAMQVSQDAQRGMLLGRVTSGLSLAGISEGDFTPGVVTGSNFNFGFDYLLFDGGALQGILFEVSYAQKGYSVPVSTYFSTLPDQSVFFHYTQWLFGYSVISNMGFGHDVAVSVGMFMAKRTGLSGHNLDIPLSELRTVYSSFDMGVFARVSYKFKFLFLNIVPSAEYQYSFIPVLTTLFSNYTNQAWLFQLSLELPLRF